MLLKIHHWFTTMTPSVTEGTTDQVQSHGLYGLCISKRLFPRPSYQAALRLTKTSLYATLLVLMLAGDIEINPGPGLASIYQCGYCEAPVGWSQDRLCCDDCDLWYHKSCVDMSSGEYDQVSAVHVDWYCYKCRTGNCSKSKYHSYNLDLKNSLDILSSLTEDDSVFSIDSVNPNFPPRHCSSPILSQRSREASHKFSKLSSTSTWKSHSTHGTTHSLRSESNLPKKSQNLRTLVINYAGISNKRGALPGKHGELHRTRHYDPH